MGIPPPFPNEILANSLFRVVLSAFGDVQPSKTNYFSSDFGFSGIPSDHPAKRKTTDRSPRSLACVHPSRALTARRAGLNFREAAFPALENSEFELQGCESAEGRESVEIKSTWFGEKGYAAHEPWCRDRSDGIRK